MSLLAVGRKSAADAASQYISGSGVEEVGGPLAVVRSAVSVDDAERLAQLLADGHTMACCGYWRDPAASHLQMRVAEELGISVRRLGDVHFSNATSRITSASGSKGGWGAIAVFYLDGASSLPSGPAGEVEGMVDTVRELHIPRGHPSQRTAAQIAEASERHSLVIVPEGDELAHSSPRRVAWLHVASDAAPPRSAFDFYFVAWVRANFIAPYDTAVQLRFFGMFTRYPRYWHAFIWSFVGMFLTLFAMLPLARRVVLYWETVYAPPPNSLYVAPRPGRSVEEENGGDAHLPTLLSRTGSRHFRHDPSRKGGLTTKCAGVVRSNSEPLV